MFYEFQKGRRLLRYKALWSFTNIHLYLAIPWVPQHVFILEVIPSTSMLATSPSVLSTLPAPGLEYKEGWGHQQSTSEILERIPCHKIQGKVELVPKGN